MRKPGSVSGSIRTSPKKGVIEQLYTAPPAGSVVVCLDEMGPQAARSFPGQQLVTPAAPKAERAKQEIDYGRRGSGYVFGAFQPASGAALTHPYDRRTTTNWVDFLGEVEAWIDPAVERIYAVADNLSTHSAPDVLLFSLLHPRWEFVFQPKYAAYLNLVRPELPMFQYIWALAAEGMKRSASPREDPIHLGAATWQCEGEIRCAERREQRAESW